MTRVRLENSMPQIPLAQIMLDQRAQPRSALNTDLTAEYAEAMRTGAQFPPLTVFHDGKAYWLADGFHRHYAATSIGMRDIACFVKSGGMREAILHSCQANSVHGLRRSDEDKRRAVKVLLADKEWATWSDREVARRCQVSHEFVRKLRPLTVKVDSEDRTFRTKHGSVSTMNTAAIGSVRLAPAAQPPAMDSASHPVPDAIPPHAALIVLARSIAELRGSPEEIAAGCTDAEEWEDLRETCSIASVMLADVLAALSSQPSDAARRDAA